MSEPLAVQRTPPSPCSAPRQGEPHAVSSGAVSANEAAARIRRLIDDAVVRGDRELPSWCRLRITRLLRELATEDERRALVAESALDSPHLRANLEESLAAAATPAPTRPARDHRGPKSREYKGRVLARVPNGTRVGYLGMGAVVRGGSIVLDDGQAFSTPTPAAQHVNGDVEVNGWDAWKLDDGRSLAQCYDSRQWPSA